MDNDDLLKDIQNYILWKDLQKRTLWFYTIDKGESVKRAPLSKMNKDELRTVLEKHLLWVKEKEGGRRANLSNVDLHGVDLSGVDLSGSSLVRCNLKRANLRDANLQYAHLDFSNLERADLSGPI